METWGYGRHQTVFLPPSSHGRFLTVRENEDSEGEAGPGSGGRQEDRDGREWQHVAAPLWDDQDWDEGGRGGRQNAVGRGESPGTNSLETEERAEAATKLSAQGGGLWEEDWGREFSVWE